MKLCAENVQIHGFGGNPVIKVWDSFYEKNKFIVHPDSSIVVLGGGKLDEHQGTVNFVSTCS